MLEGGSRSMVSDPGVASIYLSYLKLREGMLWPLS